MCLIAYRSDPDTHIPEGVINSNRRMNPDGFGIAYREDDDTTYYLRYGPDQADEFVEKLKEIDASPKVYVAHFRKGTSGANCKELAHPFPYTDPVAGTVLVFHNGIIGIPSNGPLESDTSVYVDTVLAKLEPEWWKNSAQKFLVEQTIDGSRLLVMTLDEVVILNEKGWTVRDGIMYSTFPYGYYGSYNGSYSGYNSEWRSDDSDDEHVRWGVNPNAGWKGSNYPKATSGLTAAKDGVEGDDYNPYTGKWEHMEHFVDPGMGDEEATEGVAWCNTCGEQGEFMTINGNVYIEMKHGYPVIEADIDEELLPETPKLYPATNQAVADATL